MIHFENDNLTLHEGKAVDIAANLTPGSVRTIVTSPPYFGLRDYGHEDQTGAESTVQEYVDSIVATFAALRPALADDGTLWLNLGDSYASASASGTQGRDGMRNGRRFTADKVTAKASGVRAKNLLGIPWRVAFALQADGWILRSDIIWAKPNPMPESVRDRPTKAHEYLFLFAKSPKYYYDAAAILQPAADSSRARLGQNVAAQEGSFRANGGAKINGPMRAVGGELVNKRTIWTVTTRPFKGAHFAVYPPELIRPCILAGSAPGDVVLDPFSGSGTTGMVALEEGRRYVGIDVNAEYLNLSLSIRFKEQSPSTKGQPRMSKHTKALKVRLDEIEAELNKTEKPKKRDRLKAERAEIREELRAAKVQEKHLVEEVKPVSPIDVVASAKAVGKKLAEVLDPDAGKRHLAHQEHVGDLEERRSTLQAYLTDPSNKKKARKEAEKALAEIDAELATYRKATEARTLEVAHETTGRNLKTLAAKSAETDEEIKARVLAKRAVREAAESAGVDLEKLTVTNVTEWTEPERRPEGGQTEQEAGVIHIEDEPVTIGKKAREGYAASSTEQNAADLEVAKALVDPEAVQPRDRWGRPMIEAPDGNLKGYRRMTTFIDVIDDKDNLVKWKGRVILAGVAATEQKIAGDSDLITIDEVGTESIVERVEVANQSMEESVKWAKKAHKKGKLDESALQDALDEAEKVHRHTLTDLAEEAFRAGDGYLKAETGTRIHKLTEFVDRGEELPDDTTDSERRDIAAYVAARDALGVEVKLIEQFVVLDDLEVGGTLDRLIRIDSPKLGRRVTAIGDVKTGRMDFGAGKMARQLAGYAKGKTYDWRDPEGSRKPLRANQEVGYIFNVPAGQGVCFVYELDLKIGAKGLKLCKEIFDYRSETSTLKKVGTLIHSTKE